MPRPPGRHVEVLVRGPVHGVRGDPADALPRPLAAPARARLLQTRSVSVSQAAAAVGYQSEAAFNRAFKRAMGQAPGAWRRGRERPSSG